MQEEPKDRLRWAREQRGLSRAQLAAKVGRAESTIRAHENGQNRIQPDIAIAYARELGVSPSWLLYGIDDTPPGLGETRVQEIPVVGEIWNVDFYFREEKASGRAVGETILLSLPDYSDKELSAYILRYPEDPSLSRYYLIVSSVDDVDEISLSDQVVLREKDGSYYSISVWNVGADKGWRVFYQGLQQDYARKVIKVTKSGRLQDFYEILGVVVADLNIRHRPTRPALGSPATFDTRIATPDKD
jgi:transcriptional regulator with XRE-family HTH domain